VAHRWRPAGAYHKNEIRKIAEEIGLMVAHKKDSRKAARSSHSARLQYNPHQSQDSDLTMLPILHNGCMQYTDLASCLLNIPQ